MKNLNRLNRWMRRRIKPSIPSNCIYIVGAQKAGTTALHSYLEGHPHIVCGDEKELAYFNRDKIYEYGDDYYKSCFPRSKQASMLLDASPGYLYYKECASRIHKFSPSSKIIILLREPASRAFSGYNMYQQVFNQKIFRQRMKYANKEWHDFLEEAFNLDQVPSLLDFLEKELEIINTHSDSEEPSLIRRGLYAPQIERYVEEFGYENLLILFSDDLKKSPEKVVNQVLDFCGLDGLPQTVEYPLVHAREYTVDDSLKGIIDNLAGELFEKDKFELAKKYNIQVPW